MDDYVFELRITKTNGGRGPGKMFVQITDRDASLVSLMTTGTHYGAAEIVRQWLLQLESKHD